MPVYKHSPPSFDWLYKTLFHMVINMGNISGPVCFALIKNCLTVFKLELSDVKCFCDLLRLIAPNVLKGQNLINDFQKLIDTLI